MAYAATTSVAVSKTKGEIDGLLRKHKAAGFGVFEEQTRAILVFEMGGPSHCLSPAAAEPDG
ncbi:hypothetical protein [Pseudaminobacter salicylatoxidans]|nr:hypothetical protein [Pseudaminobacter salicylatoxidans]